MSIFGNNKKHNDKFLKKIRNRIMMKFLSIIPTALIRSRHTVVYCAAKDTGMPHQ